MSNAQKKLPALGRLPVDKERIQNVLHLKDFLTGKALDYPMTSDHLTGTEFGMYENDNFGVCGPTGVANSYRLTTRLLTGKQHNFTQDEVFDLYKRSGNPDFNPKTGDGDGGVVLQTMLEEVVKNGIGGVKAKAFAKFDPSNEQELEAAMSIFGFTIDGVDLRVAQQDQTDAGTWKYVKGSPEWGGHCVLGGKYSDVNGTARDTTSVVTWAEIVKLANSFRINQQDEAWILIWPEALGSTQFQTGIDLAKLKSAYKAITGRVLSV